MQTNFNTKHGAFIRGISLCLALTLAWNQTLSAETIFAIKDNFFGSTQKPLRDTIQFPDVARVEWKSAPLHASSGVVYLFQDAHTSLLAQQRITQTLLRLHQQKALDAILVEGASQRLTSERFAGHKALMKDAKFIERLERQGYLHGAAAYFLNQPETPAFGMETAELYRRNLELFRVIRAKRTLILPLIEKLRVEWLNWMKGHVDSEYQDFFLADTARLSENVDADFFVRLISLARARLGILWQVQDQATWPQLIRAQRMIEIEKNFKLDAARSQFKKLMSDLPSSFKNDMERIKGWLAAEESGMVVRDDAATLREFSARLMKEMIHSGKPILPYRDFFDWVAMRTFRGEIEPEALATEIEKMQDLLWKSWVKTKEDQRRMGLGRLVRLLDRAANLELTRREAAIFKRAVKTGVLKHWAEHALPESSTKLIRLGNGVVKFYETAETREQTFSAKVQNTAKLLAAESPDHLPRIAIVAGGYHKDGMLEFLKKSGFETAVIAPELETIDHDVAYLDRMLAKSASESTLSFVPAAVVSRGELPALVGANAARADEAALALVLANARSEARVGKPYASVQKPGMIGGNANRRHFLGWLAGAGVLAAPTIAAAADAFADLLKDAGKPAAVTAPKVEFPAAVFPVEKLQLSTAGGMDGYLGGIMERIGRNQNLAGLKNKWDRVLGEVLKLHADYISLTVSSSQSGGIQPGLQMADGVGNKLDISSGGLSIALKAVGILIDKLLVNPVVNQSDEAAIRAAELEYQWKQLQLAVGVTKLLAALRATEAKSQILETYVNYLTQSEANVRELAANKAATDQQVNTVIGYKNDAMDAQGVLKNEIEKAKRAIQNILGEDFDFRTVRAPAPSRNWLTAPVSKKAALVESVRANIDQSAIMQASREQIEANSKGAKAEGRRGWFRWPWNWGKAKPEATRQRLGLGGEKLSSDPARARLQVLTEAGKVHLQSLRQELGDLIASEADVFFTARESHQRRQQQVAEEQRSWQTRGVLTEDYDPVRLSLLKRFVDAQLRVIDTRNEMTGAAIVNAQFEGQSANSSNWLSKVILADFLPEGFGASGLSSPSKKRSESRTGQSFFHSLVVVGILLWSGLLSALGQQPAAVTSGLPGGIAGFAAKKTGNVWEQSGKIDMSSAAGDKPALLALKIPEMVVVNQDGTMRLNDAAQIHYDQLKSEFGAGYQTYLNLKRSGAKLPTLLKEFRALLEKGIALDRLERILEALKLPQDPHFQVVRKQAGTYSEKQPIMEVVSTRVAKVQLHIPLKHLLGTKIHLEINGHKATLLSRPKVIEIDTRGEDGDAMVELTASVNQPIDFSQATPFRVWLEGIAQNSSVANHEPAEILIQSASGAEISVGVAELLRDEFPVSSPAFGTAQLSEGVSAGEIKDGQTIALIDMSPTLARFLLSESAQLAKLAAAASTALGTAGGFSADELEQLKQAAQLGDAVQAQLSGQNNLSSPANGQLEISSDLASGFPLNAGQPAAWVRTHRVLAKGAFAGNSAQLSEGDTVTARLADGRKITGKIQSITSDNKANVFGRKSFVAEFDIPVSVDDLDMSALLHDTGLSPALLFTMLAKAYQGGGEGVGAGILQSGEFAGVLGGTAGGTSKAGAQPVKVPGLAQLIANDPDAVHAMELFKKHKGQLDSEDYQTLLESNHLGLTYETAKLLLLNRKDWVEVILAANDAKDKGDKPRIRAIYDAIIAALISGGHEIEDGLQRLQAHADLDPKFRQIAESFFGTLIEGRGLNDDASRRLLDSFWDPTELAQFAAELEASNDPELQKLAHGVKGLVWRVKAAQQIRQIRNSAFADSTLKHTPENILGARTPAGMVTEYVYRHSLFNDRRLLNDGLLSDSDGDVPQIAGLIDPQTAHSVTLSKNASSHPLELFPLLSAPVTLGELDLMNSVEQESALQAAAARGDLDLLTWILGSKASDGLRQTAVATLQNNEEKGALIFAHWFATHQDAGRVAQILKSYGYIRFWQDLTTLTQKLEAKGQEKDISGKSLAPERQILSSALFRLITQEVTPLTAEKSNFALRLLLTLVSDPADLGALAQGHHPLSPESFEITQLPASGYQAFAAQELARRSVLTAIAQYPDFSTALTKIGENRPAELANEGDEMVNLLKPSSFSARAPFNGSPATIKSQIAAFIGAHVTNVSTAAALSKLATGHYDAGWSGEITVPSESITRSPLLWMLALPFVTFLFFAGKYWKLARAKYLEQKIKMRWRSYGKNGLFFATSPTLDVWKARFPGRFERPFPQEIPDVQKLLALPRRAVRGNLNQLLAAWAFVLEKPVLDGEDYEALSGLMKQSYNSPKMHLRPTIFTEFRHNDRLDDLSVIKAYLEIMILTLEKIRRDGLAEDHHELVFNLQSKIHEMTTLVKIYFALRNRRTNENYSALRRFVPELDERANVEADEEYRLKKKIWKDIRRWMGLSRAYRMIHDEIGRLYSTYLKQNPYLAAAASATSESKDPEAVEFLRALNQAYKSEIGGKYVDNGWVRQMDADDPQDNQMEQGGRRMHSREFNISGFIFFIIKAVVPAALATVYLSGWSVVLVVFGGFAWALYTSPVVLNYFDHLKTNLSGLKDPYSEEVLKRLALVVRQLGESADSEADAALFSPPVATDSITLTRDAVGSGFMGVAEELVEAAFEPEADLSGVDLLEEVAGRTASPVGVPAKAPKSLMPPQDMDWAKSIAEWNADASIAAVVFFIPENAQTSAESDRLAGILTAHQLKKWTATDSINDIEAQVQARIPELATDITNIKKNLAGKVIFVRQNANGTYSQMSETVEIPFNASPKKLTRFVVPKAEPAPVLRQRRVAPVSPEVARADMTTDRLKRELAEMQKPGKSFDAVVVAVNEGDEKRARQQMIDLVQNHYHYDVPVIVVGVPGIAAGNGMPSLAMMALARQQAQKVMQQSAVMPDWENANVLYLEAFGPDHDIARLMTGSTLFTPTGETDAEGNVLTTGDLKLAWSSLLMRRNNQTAENRRPIHLFGETDTVHLHKLPETLAGDITFFADRKKPAEVVGKYGVPIISKNSGTVFNFLEKSKDLATFLKFYNQKSGQTIGAEDLVPVFTGDVALHFDDSEKAAKFYDLAQFVYESWLKYPGTEFDIVLDFWVPLIILSSKNGTMDMVYNFADYRSKILKSGKELDDDAVRHDRLRIYHDLYFGLSQKMSALDLKLQIKAHQDEAAALNDLRRFPNLVSHLRSQNVSRGESPVVSIPLSAPAVAAGAAAVFGLNGKTPHNLPQNVPGFFMANLALKENNPIGATAVALHGLVDDFEHNESNQTHMGIPIERFRDQYGRPLFRDDMSFDDLPLFPTDLGNDDRGNRIGGLLDRVYRGENVKIAGGVDSLRKAGFISRNEALRLKESFPGRNALLFHKPARSELRSIVALVRSGGLNATFNIFHGILPLALSGMAGLAARYEAQMLNAALVADRLALPHNGALQLPATTFPEQAQQTFFIDGSILADFKIAAHLDALKNSPFKIMALFTSQDRAAYEQTRAILGGEKSGAFEIKIGNSVLEMVRAVTADRVLENKAAIHEFAYAGVNESSARRLRPFVGNLMVIKGDTPWVWLLEAFQSPRIFMLGANNPNKIWSIEFALPILLGQQLVSRSA